MVTTLHLILAHFLADFPFQPRWLANYKIEHLSGVFLHSFAHLITSAVLLFPFLNQKNVWVALALIFVTHNLIDEIKIGANKRFKINKFFTYFLDQAAHLLILALISVYYLGPLKPQLVTEGVRYYADLTIVLYILLVTLSTYFYDVTRWTYRSLKNPHPYERDYGLIGRNFLIVTIAFVIYWVTR